MSPLINHVLVGIDGSTESETILRIAADEARLRDVPLEIATVATDPLGTGDDESVPSSRAEELESLIERLASSAGIDDATVSILRGGPAHALTEAAGSAALLVIGTRGRGGFSGLLLGSTSSACLRLAQVPLMIVPPSATPIDGARRLIVEIDGTAAAKRALRWAVEEADLAPSSAVTAIAVWRRPHLWEPLLSDPSRVAERAAHHLDEAIDSIGSHECSLEGAVVEGHVVEELLNASASADVLVIANDRNEGGWLEHSAIPVALNSHAQCPVVVVP